MAWIRHDDRQTEDPTIVELVAAPKIGHRAYYERHRMMEWCARQDRGTLARDRGILPASIVQHLGAPANVVTLLVEVGLLQRQDDDSLKIRNWEKYQAPATNAERQAKYRRTHADRNGDRDE